MTRSFERWVIGLEKFSNLDCVEGGAFADLVSDDPKGEGVGEDLVFANTADEAVVFSGRVEGDRVNSV